MKIGVLLFNQFELLDVFGPLEMLGHVEDISIELVAQEIGPIKSAQGPCAYAQTNLDSASQYDVLLVPGGIGTREMVNDQPTLDWIAKQAEKARYITSVCTGSALLAKSGVLANKQATTNKMAFHWVVSQGPNTNWITKARWVKDGNIYTSSGVSAGTDMALAFIADIWGESKAREIANLAEYEWNDDSTHDCFAQKYGLE
ncbi:DJ-1/PfpI family protein [Vibrio marisflavi]|uniref:Isonitrile hydratase n=1 Tax=Vibrio marisflavi CECT 7928 TaxID=634439 RepID=A0ABM9A6R6_9VIBR|nr:DJ-1/PfpI family protein [Vibrio marisflavi]CAH0540305.1 Isonitrile hydratase [Vibrio marisflavi CECT 7928]